MLFRFRLVTVLPVAVPYAGPRVYVVGNPKLSSGPALFGTTVVFQEERGRLVLEPNNFEAIYALQGSLREFPIEASLEEERRAERKREDAR